MADRMARAGERAAFMAHHLKLTESQRAQFKEIHQKHRDTLQAKQKAAGEAREAFRKAAQDPAGSVDQLRRLHQAAADRQFEVMMEHRAVKLETRSLLTPEQRAEADRMQALGEEHRQFRMERMRKAMQHRPGRPGMGPGVPGRGPGGPGMDFD
jgi:Spy/CpxP family protein refolding chaperone